MAEEKTSCVLRLFGAPQGQLAGAVGQFAPQWKTQAQWKSRGGETLLALQAASPSGLKKAAQSLQAQFEADLYGAGDTSLAAAVVNALETHDRLLVCSDAAAGALLEARLETVPGAEKVFDFGALSYAHPKAGPQIEKRARARFKAEEPDAVRLALARAQAARRVVGSELAAGCAERGSEKVLVLSSKKGCWLRTAVPPVITRRRRGRASCPPAKRPRTVRPRRWERMLPNRENPAESTTEAAGCWCCSCWLCWGPQSGTSTPWAAIGQSLPSCPSASRHRGWTR